MFIVAAPNMDSILVTFYCVCPKCKITKLKIIFFFHLIFKFPKIVAPKIFYNKKSIVSNPSRTLNNRNKISVKQRLVVMPPRKMSK